MGRVHDGAMNIPMALGAGFLTRVRRRRAGYPEKGVAARVGDDGSPAQVETTKGLPAAGLQLRPLVQVVVARRTIPSERDAIGVFLNARHNRKTGHPTGLNDGEMLHALRRSGWPSQAKTDNGKEQREPPPGKADLGRMDKPGMPIYWQAMAKHL